MLHLKRKNAIKPEQTQAYDFFEALNTTSTLINIKRSELTSVKQNEDTMKTKQKV